MQFIHIINNSNIILFQSQYGRKENNIGLILLNKRRKIWKQQ
nr:MAG TPA: hypothetical protein [Bacteriophage sp.]